MDLPRINLSDYYYWLPEERIAKYPLNQRDQSKLLFYSSGSIAHHNFGDLGNLLPKNSTLVFNDTRVIPARLYFQKSTGATIEVLLLNPVSPSSDINVAMLAKGTCEWTCMIGNLKRWKIEQDLTIDLRVDEKPVTLTASRMEHQQVRFSWEPENLTFVELVKSAGQMPLPPYLKREAEPQDRQRYQTVYSNTDGAVAAPTAGLHFTDSLLASLKSNGVNMEYLTLHVGAGTFLPITSAKVTDHPMHGEQINITADNLDNLINSGHLIAVGTTSLRTLESIYWFGVNLINQLGDIFHIEKLAPYQKYRHLPTFRESLSAVRAHMKANNIAQLSGYTEIFIFPPCPIKSSAGLITNFHLPGSTLILLVAAFIGKDWRDVYNQALENKYRFLSYGDSSLLLRLNPDDNYG